MKVHFGFIKPSSDQYFLYEGTFLFHQTILRPIFITWRYISDSSNHPQTNIYYMKVHFDFVKPSSDQYILHEGTFNWM